MTHNHDSGIDSYWFILRQKEIVEIKLFFHDINSHEEGIWKAAKTDPKHNQVNIWSYNNLKLV